MEAVGGVFGDFVGASNSISSSFVTPLLLTYIMQQQSAIQAVEAEKIPLVGDTEKTRVETECSFRNTILRSKNSWRSC
ncbi:unnamed protein product [Camellia sinensis]